MRADGQKDIRKVTIAFRNSANAPKKKKKYFNVTISVEILGESAFLLRQEIISRLQ